MKPIKPYPRPGRCPDLSRLSLGPVIGGALTQFVGWRCIFLLSALAIVLSYAFIRPIKEEWYANGAPFVNLVSTALSVSGILCALYGLSSFEDYSAFFWAGLVLLAASSSTKGNRSIPCCRFTCSAT